MLATRSATVDTVIQSFAGPGNPLLARVRVTNSSRSPALPRTREKRRGTRVRCAAKPETAAARTRGLLPAERARHTRLLPGAAWRAT